MRSVRFLSLSLLSILSIGLSGCRVSAPSATETHVVNWTKHHITIGGKKDVNPVAASAENIEDGKQNFTSYCMVCHGLDGQNTGVPFATSIAPPIPSLSSAEVQAYTDGQLKWIIKNGISPSGMPASATEFSDDDIWHIVLYIRHLPPAGSLGEPTVYGGSAK
ncbi:c-type cytochrome [Tunturiibacter gelidoferens]|uniref:Mono/diheme cytochrome c family protein n=1 Tax=Tunturiibacter lichenicola TaxID=2051959 RepID=A0A7Y9NQS0_9BACT|nr:cytochrome c [Edaphobacter lichenicola]NYF53845.1 mono/diheme cytochrome c family protein [Edaphobacter lichenicola]